MRTNSLPFHSSELTIRDARRSDRARIVELVGAIAEHHGDVARLTEEQLARDAFSSAPWVYLLVAETADGRIVGYAALCPLLHLQFGARSLDLHHLFVEPGFRRKGVGAVLIEGVKRKATALDCVQIYVGALLENTDAQAFYIAQGFEPRPSATPRFRLKLT